MSSHQFDKKKRDEKAIFEAFSGACPAVPCGEIDSTSENPDVVLTTDEGHALGVELTELLIDDDEAKLRRSNITRALVTLRQAQKLYFERGLPPVRAVVEFDETAVLRKGDHHILSDKLATFVAGVADLDWTADLFVENMHDNLDVLPKVFKSMWLERADGRIDWDRSGGGSFATMTVEYVTRMLDVKEKKVARYRLRCNELWLVIYYDTDEATWLELPDTVTEHAFETSFDRVFLFNWFRQQPLELQVSTLQA